jgi:hypothetical protein
MNDVTLDRPRMSVADPRFNTDEALDYSEVNQMTTVLVTAGTAPTRILSRTAHHGRAGGFDLLVMRLSLWMLRRARNHAERSFPSWEDASLRRQNALERENRERSYSLAIVRIF